VNDVHNVHVTVTILVIGGKVETSRICGGHGFVNQIAGPHILYVATAITIGTVVVMGVSSLEPADDTPRARRNREPAIGDLSVIVLHAPVAGAEQQRVEI
jgi:hypothetical protein